MTCRPTLRGAPHAATGWRSACASTPDQEFVLFGVSGPCVDVPEDEREAWDRKQEPQPDVLGSPS